MKDKENPYYHGNDDTLPIMLQAKSRYGNISMELPWDANLDNICQAFFAMCIGLSYPADSILNAMKEFAHEELDIKKYNLSNIDTKATDDGDKHENYNYRSVTPINDNMNSFDVEYNINNNVNNNDLDF